MRLVSSRRDHDVLDRFTLLAVIAAFFALLAPGSAFASVKCQCNNGSIVNAMGADYDDEDVDEECNDACSTQGGGRAWSVDRDQDDGDDDTTTRGGQRPRQTPKR
jgi:hypothetical protein